MLAMTAGVSVHVWALEEIAPMATEVLMGRMNGAYDADFPVGTKVRIKSRHLLQDFQRTWRFHDPLKDSQLDYAGQIATVDRVGYYFGADELYWLAGIPGVWNELCLPLAEHSNSTTHFSI